MEARKIKMNMDGTFRAKVLQYKPDGNTLTEKWHTLTKFAEGIYFSYTTPDRYGHRSVNVIFSKNGIFWRVGGEPEHYFSPESFRYAEHMETLKKRYANYEADIMQAVANGGWLNKLHITVMGRLGYDTTAMVKAYNERRRKMEELDRQRAEEAERRERERKEAEERRKAEVLADGKEKLLKHECITVEQIELIAETVGYKIHIRTLGFMREKVTEAVLREDDTVTVWGRKLTSRNIDGTANVMRELCDRLKAQAEEEVQRAAQAAETPRISTETAEVTNVSTEGGNAENEPIKHISEIMETCRTWDDEKRDYTDEYKYYTWLANHIPEHKATNKNTAELILEEVRGRISAVATLAAHGVPKCDIEGAVCAVVNRLAKMEDILQFYNRTDPPQPPETPQTVECTIDAPKPRETAGKRQNRGIGNTRHSGLGANGYAMLDNASATLAAMSVPRECPTAEAACW